MDDITKQLVEKINRIEDLWRPRSQGGNPGLASKEVDGLLALAKAHINQTEKERIEQLNECNELKKGIIKQEYHIKALEKRQKPDEELKFRVKQAIEILSPVVAIAKATVIDKPKPEQSLMISDPRPEMDEKEKAFYDYSRKIGEVNLTEREKFDYEKYKEGIEEEFTDKDAASEYSITKDIKELFNYLSGGEAKKLFKRFFTKAEKKKKGYVYKVGES